MTGFIGATIGALTSLDYYGYGSLSVWGTSQAPLLPAYLPNGPMPQGTPWSLRTVRDTNPYTDPPNTGVTRHYNFDVTKQDCAPDGVNITCLLVNKQLPGPLIEANWGDYIEVTVTNSLQDEGTSIHWHGMLQSKTNWMDGTPGMAQCPIAPSSSFTYRFQASLHGTSWWHSHYSAQYGSGLFGPVVIYGPIDPEIQYDEDLGPVMIHDWYHGRYEDVVKAMMQPIPNAVIPASDNNLINGKNNFDCRDAGGLPCKPDVPLASFNFVAGKTYRLRLINPGSAAVEKFSIDDHKMTVIANDFVQIEPYETDVVTLAVGQRTDVLVKATGEAGQSYWARAFKPPACWPSKGGNEAKAAIFYQNSKDKTPTTQPGPKAYNTNCGNDSLNTTRPIYPVPADPFPYTEILPVVFRPNETGYLTWYMANQTMRVDYNDPLLLEVKTGKTSFDPIRSVHDYGTNKSLRFVVENAGPQPHPMHLHGHNFLIVAEGPCDKGPSSGQQLPPGVPPRAAALGSTSAAGDGRAPSKRQSTTASEPLGSCWDGHLTNPSNPQRRDVQMLPAYSYIVVQWEQNNPGVWPFHCHIAWHLSEGMLWNVLERPGDVQKELEIPSVMAQTCRDWAAWTGGKVVEQIDSGL